MLSPKPILHLPVFSMTATAIGYWAIGGYVPQYAGIGQNMAEQAYLFLDKGEEQHQQYLFIAQQI